MDLGLILIGAAGLLLISQIFTRRRRPPKTAPIFQPSELWLMAHPFEAETWRIMRLILKRDIVILNQNLNAPFDMVIGDKRPEVLIKCVDLPSKPIPAIYLDRLILAKEQGDARKAFLITTGYFTRQMRVDAADNGVILISGDEFHKLQLKHPKADEGQTPQHPHARYMRPRNTRAPQ